MPIADIDAADGGDGKKHGGGEEQPDGMGH